MKPTSTQAAGMAGIGGALGVITVWVLGRFVLDTPMAPEEASFLTAAFGTVFAALVRYLPKPGA